jgi:hypothetical protein
MSAETSLPTKGARVAIFDTRNEIHALRMKLHYATCDSGVGHQPDTPAR